MTDQVDSTAVPPKRLLCLDGGGIKGISSLMILQAVMEEVARLQTSTASAVNQKQHGVTVASSAALTGEPKPVDYFDLTGGTSTGGLIAVMLLRLGMSCSDAIRVWSDVAKEVFATRVFGVNIDKIPIIKWTSKYVLFIKMLFGAQFNCKYLDQEVLTILKAHPDPDGKTPKLLVDDSRYKSPDAKGKMLVCTTSVKYGKAILFRNYTPPSDAIPETKLQDANDGLAPAAPPYSHPGCLGDDPDLWQRRLHDIDYNQVGIENAVRATSAAPTYFRPEWIQDLQFWDGGLLNNNPVDQVWWARYDLAPDFTSEPYVSTVLSIGTTYSNPPDKVPMGLLARLLRTVNRTIDFATNVEAKALDFKRNMYRRNLRQPKGRCTEYFRFNACLGDTVVDLADYKKIPFVMAKTKEYLAGDDVRDDINRCARLLLGYPVEEYCHSDPPPAPPVRG